MTQDLDDADFPDVADNLETIGAQIARAARDAGREPETVTLIAVSKMFEAGPIRAALRAGHRVFGENRVQEAQQKWPALRADHGDVDLHMIGPLQSNKAADAVTLFDAIHSVDRPKLARKLADAMDEQDRRPACFIQINTGEEPQKSGVLPADADDFITRCREDFTLPVEGLMCLPPVDSPPAPHFALLADIAARNGLDALSMGMSADFEQAIALGATHIRLGTAVFGPRPQKK